MNKENLSSRTPDLSDINPKDLVKEKQELPNKLKEAKTLCALKRAEKEIKKENKWLKFNLKQKSIFQLKKLYNKAAKWNSNEVKEKILAEISQRTVKKDQKV